MSRLRTLYVEDTGRDAGEVREYFASHAVDVVIIHRGGGAIGEVARLRPDVVIVDIGPPGQAGLDLCSAVRELSAVPIITVSSIPRDAVAALDAGADDFVAKPFLVRELLARVRSQARRARGGPMLEMIRLGPLRIDPRSMIVSIDDVQVVLTPIEFECLHALAKSAGETLTREHLCQTLYGSTYRPGNVRTVDVVVSRLRQKLGDDRRRPRWIRAVRNVGYMLTLELPDDVQLQQG